MIYDSLIRLYFLIWMTAAEPDFVFPPDFKFGVSTSAYQIEGGYNEDGKGYSVWDRITQQTPAFIVDGTNGNIACDSYHRWEEDIQNLKSLGVHYYRFSLAWTRILPGGYTSNVNQAGLDYYNNLIDGLLANNIEPVVTIYHWDMPQKISALGGIANEVYVEYFVNYARKAFELFGDRVKIWITFNEPSIICDYFNQVLGMYNPNHPNGVIEYLSSNVLLKAHAEVYHLYVREFKAHQKGRIGITLNVGWSEPASNQTEDIEAANRQLEFELGRFINPLVHFDNPKVVVDRVRERSELEGFPKSRLPPFTLEERMKIRGTYDFIGINHYTSWNVANAEEAPSTTSSLQSDTRVARSQDPSWPDTGVPDNKIVPWGFRKLLRHIKENYNNPEILVTECGYADTTGEIDDEPRINFFKEYLGALLEAIHIDKVNVKAFMAWSLMDNFEWNQGYTQKFGFFQVDFNDPNRTRTAKKSAGFYQQVIANNSLKF